MDDSAFQRADAETRAALTMLMAGQVADGLKRYRAALRLDLVHRIPAGLHILLLEKAGQAEAAEALRALALSCGFNLAIRPVALNAPPQEAMLEYERLFAAGTANAQMVAQYLQALSAQGRAEMMQRWLAPELLFRTVQLDRGQAAEVERAMLAREQGVPLQAEEKSALGMRRLDDMHRDPDPILRNLFASLAAEARAYLKAWADSDHPLAGLVPATIKLNAWGQISRGAGSNVPHIHPTAWATGVYYPTSAGGGALCIGGPDRISGAAQGWFETEVVPEAGLLVLMPPYYTHWTLPLGRDGLRLSIAFDAVADLRTDAGAQPIQ